MNQTTYNGKKIIIIQKYYKLNLLKGNNVLQRNFPENNTNMKS